MKKRSRVLYVGYHRKEIKKNPPTKQSSPLDNFQNWPHFKGEKLILGPNLVVWINQRKSSPEYLEARETT